ncbi:ATP-binding protein [Xanthomonas sp. 60]
MAQHARVALTPAQAEWIQAHPQITLAINRMDMPPFEIHRGDHLDGLSSDYLDAAAEQLGVRVVVRRFDNLADIKRAACAGEVDLLMNIPLIPELTRCLVYGQSRSISPVALVGRSNDSRLLQPDLRGVRLAVRGPGQVAAEVAKRYPDARLLLLPSEMAALDAVAAGQADAYVGNAQAAQTLIAESELVDFILVRPVDVPDDIRHFAVPNDRVPLIEALDRALESLPPAERTAMERRWLAPLKWGSEGRLVLSQAEREVLSQPLRLGLPPQWAPLSFVDGNGRANGLAGAYVQHLRENGAVLDLVPARDWQEVRRQMQARQVDVVMGVPIDAQNIPRGWVFSPPFITLPNVIVTRTGQSSRVLGLQDLHRKSVAVTDAERIGPQLQRRALEIRIVEVTDVDQGLRLLDAGQVDAVIGNLVVVEDLLRRLYPGRLEVSASAGIEDSFAMAVRQPYAPLVTTFNRLLARLGPSGQAAIRNNWLAVEYRDGLQWREIFPWAAPLLAVLLTAVSVLALSHLRIRREVRMRRRAEQRLQEVTESLPAVVFQVRREPDGRMSFPFIFGDVQELFGISLQQALADERAMFARVHPEDQGALMEVMEDSARTGSPIDVQFRSMNNQGQWRWLRSRTRVASTLEGAMLWIGYWIDVTEQHEQAVALAAAVESRSEFLATMSHEIRTPMAGILGLLEILSHGDLDPQQEYVLDTINESAQMLRQILDDILDFSRMEAGALQMEPLPTDLRAIIGNVEQLLQAKAIEKQLVLSSHVDPVLASRHVVDGTRLRQILFNLVSNAIKFTEHGEVAMTLSCSAAHGSPAVQDIVLRVRDTGIGIAAEHQAVLFEPFTQAHLAINRRFGGTGLGLSICRRLVDQMGGDITLRSEEGQGTEVEVRLCLEIARTEPGTRDALPGPVAAVAAATDLHVLVAEDQGTNQMLMAWRMEQVGLPCRIVSNGREALDALSQQRYDLLITDCRMPVMDGYALAAVIREGEREAGARPMPILAMTASAMPEQVRRCLDVGMDAVLAKPVSFEQLHEALAHWLPRAPATAVAPALQAERVRTRTAPPALACEPFPDAVWHLLDGIQGPAVATAQFGSLAAFAGLVRQMVRDSQRQLQLLDAAVTQQDAHGVETHLHALAGGLGIIGAADLADRVRALMIDLEFQGLPAQAGQVRAMSEELRGVVACLDAGVREPAMEPGR